MGIIYDGGGRMMWMFTWSDVEESGERREKEAFDVWIN